MVNLSQADTVGELKQAIEGRIQALANVHSLFVASRWIGAELTAIAKQELAPYAAADGQRVQVDGPEVLLEPDVAQAIAVILHEPTLERDRRANNRASDAEGSRRSGH